MPASVLSGELERAVMERLWSLRDDDHPSPEAGWMTVREVHAAIGTERGLAYTTVMTVLSRLAGKSLVDTTKSGRALRYRAAADRYEVTADLMVDALRTYSMRDEAAALTELVAQLTDEEQMHLRRALDRRRAQRHSGPRPA